VVIDVQTGPMTANDVVPFDAFMDAALYGPEGFYSGQGRAGRRGDFITSPEVGPLFGAVIARFLDAEWRRAGSPDTFAVYEVGAGPGTLARSVLASGAECLPALRYTCVEISAAQRDAHPEGVTSLAGLPDGELDGVVLANELLDNIPFRLAVFDGGWREACVRVDDGRPVEVLSAVLDPCPGVLPAQAPHGARAPLADRAVAWVDDVVERLCGVLVTWDYFCPTTAACAARGWREWLRTYRGHDRGGHYLATPGQCDITYEPPLDQFRAPDAVRTQAQWLAVHGIDDLVAEGRRVWEESAAAPDLRALTMRSRVSEAEALTAVDGLGGFTAVEWRGVRPTR